MRFARLLALAILLTPITAYAALININTADSTTLQTLTGIGPSKAQAIIDYRTEHGPFARIEDIQNVSGIGPSTYANIQSLITVGDAVSGTPAASTTPILATASGSSSYVPPPSTLQLSISGSSVATLHVPLHLTAQATIKGVVDSLAQIVWSFGDGSMQTGTVADKVYEYPGTYLVVARASDGGVKASSELTVVVQSAILAVSVVGEGVVVANNSATRLDLSLWRLMSDTGTFRIPEGTTVLPNTSVLFPYTISNLPHAATATLLYPDGTVAARSEDSTPTASTSEMKLLILSTRTNQVQAVEPIISPVSQSTSYDQAVVAPAASSDLAAAGAPLADAATSAEDAAPTAPRTGLFHSPWLMGLVGVIALAGSAFIFI